MDHSQQFDFPAVQPPWLSTAASWLTVAMILAVLGIVSRDADNSLLAPCFILLMISVCCASYVQHTNFIRSIIISEDRICFVRRAKPSVWHFLCKLRPIPESNLGAPEFIPLNNLISAEARKSTLWIYYTDEKGLQSEFHLWQANMETAKWKELISQLKEISTL